MYVFRSPRTQEYLIRVYGTLAMTSIVTALTMAASMFEMIPEPNGFEVILSFAVIFGVQMSRELVNERWRLGGLLAFGFLQGWHILTKQVTPVPGRIVIICYTFLAGNKPFLCHVQFQLIPGHVYLLLLHHLRHANDH